MKRDDRGYTLMEMLVVIGIIALLAAVLTPALIGQLSRARIKMAHLQLETVSSAVEEFRSDVGRYPTLQEGLRALVENPKDAEGWIGPYLRDQKALNDPWGRPIIYRLDPAGDQFQLVSLGPQGKEGGTGPSASLHLP